jgi:hypothetical protein
MFSSAEVIARLFESESEDENQDNYWRDSEFESEFSDEDYQPTARLVQSVHSDSSSDNVIQPVGRGVGGGAVAVVAVHVAMLEGAEGLAWVVLQSRQIGMKLVHSQLGGLATLMALWSVTLSRMNHLDPRTFLMISTQKVHLSIFFSFFWDNELWTLILTETQH